MGKMTAANWPRILRTSGGDGPHGGHRTRSPGGDHAVSHGGHRALRDLRVTRTPSTGPCPRRSTGISAPRKKATWH